MIVLLKFLEFWSLRINKKLTIATILGTIITLWYFSLFEYSLFQKIIITAVSIIFGIIVLWKDKTFELSLNSLAYSQVCLVTSAIHPLFTLISDDVYEKYISRSLSTKGFSVLFLVAISIMFHFEKNIITHYGTLIYCLVYLLGYGDKVLRDMEVSEQFYSSIRLLSNLFILESVVIYYSMFQLFTILSFCAIFCGVLYKYLKYKKRGAWIKLNFIVRKFLQMDKTFIRDNSIEHEAVNRKEIINRQISFAKESLDIEYIVYLFIVLFLMLSWDGIQ